MAVEIKGLTKDERDLITVARYYNTNMAAIEAVIAKLGNEVGFDNSTIAVMTGFSSQRVGAIVRGDKRTVKSTKRIEAPKVEVKVEPIVPEAEHGLQKFADVAKEIVKLIETLNLKRGDKLPTNKELSERFGVTTATTTRAIARLKKQKVVDSIRGKGTFVA